MKRAALIRSAVGLFSVAAFGAVSHTARAETACGTTPGGWNAPNGAAIFEYDPQGTISQVLANFGEYYSHAMLSRGPNWWVTHATSSSPASHTTTDCDNPIDKGFMGASTPGLSTIDQGGAYTFLYLNGGTPQALYYYDANTYNVTPTCPAGQSCYESGGGIYEPLGPVVGNDYLGVPDNAGDSLSWIQGAADGVWPMAFSGPSGTSQPAEVYYGWNQYMNVGTTAQGIPMLQKGETAQGYGIVCSSALAMWQHDALWTQPSYTGDVLPRTYTNPELTNAAWTLWDQVYNRCSGGLNVEQDGDLNLSNLHTDLAALFAVTACIGKSVCGNAANQVTNAFADDGFVDDQAAEWQNIIANTPAVSISPDDIACIDLPSNGTGSPCSGPHSSIWGGQTANVVQWNSGGSQNGCWE